MKCDNSIGANLADGKPLDKESANPQKCGRGSHGQKVVVHIVGVPNQFIAEKSEAWTLVHFQVKYTVFRPLSRDVLYCFLSQVPVTNRAA